MVNTPKLVIEARLKPLLRRLNQKKFHGALVGEA